MKIARLEDRISIDLGEVKVKIAPLSGRHKQEMTSMIKQGEDSKFYIDKPAQELFLIKHSIKEVSGIKDFKDNDYQLEFDGSALTDKCAEELLGFLVSTWFTTANTQAMHGMFGEVINPISGKVINGIHIALDSKENEEVLEKK